VRTARAGIGLAALMLALVAAWRLWLLLGAHVPAAPAFADVRARHRTSDVLVLDRHGRTIHEIRIDPERRRLAWLPLSDISPALIAAVLASEDRRFHAHGGVDVRAVAAAARDRLRGRPLRGASTITMQLATLLSHGDRDPGPARPAGGGNALRRKWRQMRLAWRIEAGWTKQEILEAYLNLVTYRGEIQGISAAARELFGKAAHGLDEAESAVLAALLRAPNAPSAPLARRAWAVMRARRAPVPVGFEPDRAGPGAREAVRAAVDRALHATSQPVRRVFLAPHAALRAVRGDGSAAAVPPPPGVTTTLDAGAQRVAVEALRRHLSAVRHEHVQDGAVLAVDNASGDVLVYVGGSGDLSSARHVDGIRARRQAGSTLKPFLYGLALDRRLITPASLLEDTPLDVPVTGGVYRPRNYDEAFRGLVSARTALASSLNVPAVRTLGLLGEDAALEQLRRLGFDGLTEAGDFYGPSMALGSVDVSLWELVAAYRALARGGVWNSSRLVPHGPVQPERRVYSERAAFLVSSILSDRESRSVTFGLENVLGTRFWSAVKTGTSKEMRDNWCVGYSRRYTVGVWVGNFSGAPMRNVSGVTGAAPVWAEVMNWLHRAEPSAPPSPPAGLRAAPVAFPGGAEADRVEWFIAGTEPGPLPRADGDEAGGAGAGPVAARGREAGVAASRPPLAGGHPRIISPVSGTIIALDPDIPAAHERLVFEARDVAASLRWVLDGRDLGAARDLVTWAPARGRHTLLLVDEAGRAVDRATFEVRGSGRRAAAR
jgi:penicillin-binding protein 1C